MAITLGDIAGACGVSRMTVSLVLNGKGTGKVSPPVQKRVLSVAKQLGYHPNQHARRLKYGSPEGLDFSGGTVPVTMLLPCPGFLEHGGSDVETLLEVFNGALKAATLLGTSLETVPVSRNNNPVGIEWSWLSKLDSRSLILAPASWFMLPLLELHRRGCRISLISPTGFWLNLYARYVKDWSLFRFEYEQSAHVLTEKLYASGYRRIAFAAWGSYLDEPDFPLLAGYRQALQGLGLGWEHVIPIRTVENLSKEFRQAYEEQPFDALVYSPIGKLSLDYTLSLAANFNLPEDVCIVSTLDRDDYQRLRPKVSAMKYPFRQMGYDAVAALLQEHSCAGVKEYTGSFELRGMLEECHESRVPVTAL